LLFAGDADRAEVRNDAKQIRLEELFFIFLRPWLSGVVLNESCAKSHSLFLGLNQTLENRLRNPKKPEFQAVFRQKDSFLLEHMNRPLPRA
jgi:hypothetical protein